MITVYPSYEIYEAKRVEYIINIKFYCYHGTLDITDLIIDEDISHIIAMDDIADDIYDLITSEEYYFDKNKKLLFFHYSGKDYYVDMVLQ